MKVHVMRNEKELEVIYLDIDEEQENEIQIIFTTKIFCEGINITNQWPKILGYLTGRTDTCPCIL